MAFRNNIFTIKHNDLKPDKGRLLISEPFLSDAYFQRSVVLLVEHDESGSIGLVLNKKSNLTLNSFFPEFKNSPDIPIYIGGPVASNSLFYIHTLGDAIIPESFKVADGLFFSGEFEAMKEYLLYSQDNDLAHRVKFFLGYSGWDANQLKEEITQNSWLVSNHIDIYQIMQSSSDSSWIKAVDNLGSDYELWKNFPKNPNLN